MNSSHVLVVSNEPHIIMPLELLLRRSGYRVSIARDGPEARATIRAAPYDLVLLDTRLPGVDGYQLCRQLRARPECNATKVILLSAKSPPADVRQDYEAGADLYISKPFSPRQLLEKVRELLRGKQEGTNEKRND